MLRFMIATGAIVLVLSSALRGQTQSTIQTVTIEPSSGGVIDVRFSPTRFTARSATVAELIEHAYGMKAWQIFGGPDWVRVERFTVRVTTAVPIRREEMPFLLQGVLASRFHLDLMREARTISLYRLTKVNVRNLKPAAPTERPVINVKEVDNAGYRWEGRPATMVDLATVLSQHLRAPVIDDTTLLGTFNFRLDFTQDDVFANADSDAREGPTIFAALEQQLGLKLVRDKGLVHGYVIRRVSKPPNAP